METVELKGKTLLFRELSREELIEVVENLYNENIKLKDQLNLNSKNSSRPPATDTNKPSPKSSREKSDKNPGGQEGHDGTTLEKSEQPDEIVKHELGNCLHCGHDLSGVVAIEQEGRQEIDIVPSKKVVREHLSYSKACPSCHCINQAKFPEGINKSVQYGKNIKAKSVYYHERQLIPYARVKELMKDEYDLDISTGTLVNFNQECYQQTSVPSSLIKMKMISSKVCSFDET